MSGILVGTGVLGDVISRLPVSVASDATFSWFDVDGSVGAESVEMDGFCWDLVRGMLGDEGGFFQGKVSGRQGALQDTDPRKDLGRN